MKMDMSRLLKISVISLLFTSCQAPIDKMEKKYWKDSAVNGTLLNFLQKAATDSIQSWIDADLDFTQAERYNNWYVDSIFVVNREKNRAIGMVLYHFLAQDQSDLIKILYCEKRNGKWFFFMGENYVLPRETYAKKLDVPLTFGEMSKIGRKIILKGYYGYLPFFPYAFWAKEQNFTGLFWGTEEDKKLYITRKSRIKERVEGLELFQNEPNPFKLSTKVKMKIPKELEEVFLKIYDKDGNCVKKFEVKGRGDVEETINKGDLQEGIYSYTFSIKGSEQGYKKMEVLR